jgi:hypothetical protein
MLNLLLWIVLLPIANFFVVVGLGFLAVLVMEPSDRITSWWEASLFGRYPPGSGSMTVVCDCSHSLLQCDGRARSSD